uniref:Uncharacterized protein n=1 Tax=Phlebia radiata TaxID=5308 RepID=L8B9H0_PHLRA|nr:hypothetical protein Pra_mt0316 [Phlebia radiata]CCF07384.1 hypothetical protein Pra_mt0316 [Phlebia radiata]
MALIEYHLGLRQVVMALMNLGYRRAAKTLTKWRNTLPVFILSLEKMNYFILLKLRNLRNLLPVFCLIYLTLDSTWVRAVDKLKHK